MTERQWLVVSGQWSVISGRDGGGLALMQWLVVSERDSSIVRRRKVDDDTVRHSDLPADDKAGSGNRFGKNVFI